MDQWLKIVPDSVVNLPEGLRNLLFQLYQHSQVFLPLGNLIPQGLQLPLIVPHAAFSFPALEKTKWRRASL